MAKKEYKLKLAFVEGLREIVKSEVDNALGFNILEETVEYLYIGFYSDLSKIEKLRSILKAYLITQDTKFTPRYIANHKSILGDMVDIVIANKSHKFETFKLICAGADSLEVRSIASYIKDTYKLLEKDEADLKIHIIKKEKIWECGVQITPMPLSARNYRVMNMGGAMNSTIAYAVNSLCNLYNAESYLNVFSGSATLLIEAAHSYPHLKVLKGFDNNKVIFNLALQNIKKAGFMKRIQVLVRDIFDMPDLGKFDSIASDLPFGMTILKGDDLEALYECFIEYCQIFLKKKGTLVTYTNEHKLLAKVIGKSGFKINQQIQLKLSTTPNAYIHPQIFVCKFK